MERVCAVIVTYNRKDLLRKCLTVVLSQTRPPDQVLVVDNYSTDGTREMLENEFPQIEALLLPENRGSGGGFHEGIKWAYEAGYDWIWVMDDDALPTKNCVEVLLYRAQNLGLEAIGPLCVDSENPSSLSFPVLIGNWAVIRVNETPTFIRDHLWLWNGVLLHRSVVCKVGLPKPELFIRGDELDYQYRIKRSKIPSGTITECKILHPSVVREARWLFQLQSRRRLMVVDSGKRFKNFYIYRNTGYLTRKYYKGNELLFRVILEFLKYSFFFFFLKRSFTDWKEWYVAFTLGLKQELTPYQQ